MDFKNIDKKYRPVPFWSWNEKLNVPETLRQVGLMDDVGIGGFFMHARGGLQTEYMGEEWFENVTACVEEAEKRGMHAWAYDENGWPSGFGGGKVNGLGVEYQQKSLHSEPLTDDNKDADTDEYTQTQQNTPKQVDYRKQLIARLNELGIDVTEYAQKHGLTNKTPQDTFKDLLTDLG